MAAGRNFDPDVDIPSLKDKVIFITGGTAGLGQASIQALAKHEPAHIYFTGRNSRAANELISQISQIYPGVLLTFVPMDLSSLSSITEALKPLSLPRLDVLICCAGIMAVGPQLSPDGYEKQFATNHLGHAALIQILLPSLLRTASDARIVLLTSAGWALHPKNGIDFATLHTPQPGFLGHWVRYGQSKLANLVYARSLATRYPSIKTVAVHPGVVKTGLVGNLGFWDELFVKVTNLWRLMPPEKGAGNQLFLAVGLPREEVVSGAVYYPVGVPFEGLDKVAKSEVLEKELWEWTERALEKARVDRGEEIATL